MAEQSATTAGPPEVARRTAYRLPVRANMTPMIDVVFLLIVFFMLVAHITRDQSVELELVELDAERSVELTPDGKVVLNVVPASQRRGPGDHYRIGSMTFGDSHQDVEQITDVLIALRERRDGVGLVLRAAHDQQYRDIDPVLRAAAAAGMQAAHIATVPRRGRAR